MKFLIYGSKGWIGGLFVDFLKKTNIDYTEGKLRLESPDLEDELKESEQQM